MAMLHNSQAIEACTPQPLLEPEESFQAGRITLPAGTASNPVLILRQLEVVSRLQQST
jgi:hypothetical protein